ncbi:MAG: hypothetical protein AAGG51_10855 [Cyanobacteria bacterium P01_G01_bin.54]
MPYEADEILAELGYTLSKGRLSLPLETQEIPQIQDLKQRLEDALVLTNLSSEAARREALVFPVLLEVARFHRCQIRIEYPLHVNNWLRGNLDYLLQQDAGLIIVEAKNDDLTRGFTQLAAEMIALAQAEKKVIVYGAITMGDVWRFGRLDAQKQAIVQDITLYRVPDDLQQLTQIIVGILNSNPSI